MAIRPAMKQAPQGLATVLGQTQSGAQAAQFLGNHYTNRTMMVHPDLPGAFVIYPHGGATSTGTFTPQFHPRFLVKTLPAPSNDFLDQSIQLMGLDRFLALSPDPIITDAIEIYGPLTLIIGERSTQQIIDNNLIESTERYQRQSQILDIVAHLLRGSLEEQKLGIKTIGGLGDPELVKWLLPFQSDPRTMQLATDAIAQLEGQREDTALDIAKIGGNEAFNILLTTARNDGNTAFTMEAIIEALSRFY
jgi:hypothetical protein